MEGYLKRVEQTIDQERWPIILDGSEMKIVRGKLSMNEAEKDATILSAARILGNCSNPYGLEQRRVGLAIGKVQSGKTSNFISLMALAFDNNINIVVLFGGSSKILKRQADERILESFDFEERAKNNDRSLTFLTTSNNFDNLSPDEIGNIYRMGRKIIITALKEYTHIERVLEMLKNANLDKKPILIIDDEGDQITLNGAVKKDKTTTTYREFVNLFSSLSFSTFISVTATPEANLLIELDDELSPDFCELISPGKLYSGAETFHSEPYSKYISVIPEDENVILEDDQGIPESFEVALSTFFVGGIIRGLRGDYGVHSMLIHPSSRIIDHKKVKVKVEAVLKKYQEISNSDEEDIFKFFENFVRKGYDELSKTIDEQFNFDIILEQMKKDIFDVNTVVVNGDGDKEIIYRNFRYFIVIGGSMVERGLTVKNLAVTYIVRTNKGKENADTVLQRCRWFGYRISKIKDRLVSYLDVCRVYMIDSMANNFYELKLTEDSIWNCIKHAQKSGKALKEMDRLFKLSGHFNPTRPNVILNTQVFSFGDFKTQHSIKNMNDQSKINIINDRWEEMLKKYDFSIQDWKNFKHYIYKDVEIKDVLEIIKEYYPQEYTNFDSKYIDTTLQLLEINEKPTKMNVVLMRYELKNGGTGEDHKINPENYYIGNIMQGRNGVEGEDNYYPSDQYILPKEIQLQIHFVNNKELNLSKIPVLGYYAPLNEERLVGKSV